MYNVINMRDNYHQRQGLIDLVEYIKNRYGKLDYVSLLEVGCYQGESSEIFAENFGSVTCVDIWENDATYMDGATGMYDMALVESNFDERMSKFTNVHKIKCDFNKFDITYKDFNVIYIDANHEYEFVKRDITKVLPYMSHMPLYICGHDYTEGWPGVIQAVDELFEYPDEKFQDGSWLVEMSKFYK